MKWLQYLAAGTVFRTVLCRLLLTRCSLRCTSSVAAAPAAPAKTPPQQQLQQLPNHLHAFEAPAAPYSVFFTAAAPQSSAAAAASPACLQSGALPPLRALSSSAFSAISSALKSGDISMISWSRNVVASASPPSPPHAVSLLRYAYRLRRRRTPHRHSPNETLNPIVTCCVHQHTAAVPVRVSRRPSSRVAALSLWGECPTRERCLFRHRFADSSAAADPSASAAAASAAAPASPSAAPASPAAALRTAGDARTSPSRSSAVARVSPSSWSSACSPLESSPPGPVVLRGLRLYSSILGAAALPALRRRARIPAAASPHTKERPAAAVSVHADASLSRFAVAAVQPQLLLPPLHRIASVPGGSCSRFRVAAAASAPLSSATASFKQAARPFPSRGLPAALPAAEEAPVPSVAAASAVTCSLALPRFLASGLLRRYKSPAAVARPASPAAAAVGFLPPAVSSLAAAAASCLFPLLPAAVAAADGSAFPSRSHAAASAAPAPSPPRLFSASSPAGASASSAIPISGAAHTGPPAVRSTLNMSSPASAAASSSSASFYSSAAGAAQQQQAVRMMKLQAGDGHGGDGLHFFPSLSPPQPRQPPLARGGAGRVSPAAAASPAGTGPAGGAGLSPAAPSPGTAASASSFSAGGGAAAVAGRGEEEQQGEPATLIFLHGLGDTAEGWSDMLGLACSALPNAAAFLRVILPTADVRPVALTGGVPTHAWADVAGLTRSAPEDEAGFLASKARIDTIIKEEVAAGVSPSRVLLGGFSQGGALAYLVGLQSSYRLGGLICLSTWLPLTRLLKLNAACTRPRTGSSSNSSDPRGYATRSSPYTSSSNPFTGAGGSSTPTTSSSSGGGGSNTACSGAAAEDPTPVLHCHGEQDEVVSFSYGEESAMHVRQLYIQAGVSTAAADRAIQFRRYPGLGHSANNRELADVKDFIAHCLLH